MKILLNKTTGGQREIVYFRTDDDNSQIHAEFVDELVATGKYEIIEKED